VLLDHLFGIQNRAGCSCAGPYGHRLLGIDASQSELYRRQSARGVIGVKPGWVRLSLPYYASDEDIEFLLSAVEFVADHGRAFLSDYELGWLDGVWRHRERPMNDVKPIELTVDALVEAAQSFAAGDHEQPMSIAQIRAERRRAFDEARVRVAELEARARQQPPAWNPGSGQADVDRLVWFDYVHADAPWARVPREAPARPVPSRCGFVSDGAVSVN
jgi:hypothetical protein